MITIQSYKITFQIYMLTLKKKKKKKKFSKLIKPSLFNYRNSVNDLLQQQNAEFLEMLQNDINNFPNEQPIQLDEPGLDEAIEILDNAQEHLNQNFEQALIDQNHDDYDSDSSFEDLEGDFLAIARGIRNQIPLIPPGNQTFEQLPYELVNCK